MHLDWGKALSVWWSFFWRATIYGVLLGAALGFLAGMYAALSGVPDKATVYGGIAGWVGAIPGSMLALKQAISKHLGALAALARGNAS
jgi:nitrate reductase gamma subunit